MRNPPVEIRPILHHFDEIDALAKLAHLEGVRNVAMLAEELKANTFSMVSGVLLLGGWQDRDLVAIGGRTWCPDVQGALRMRRFFVAPLARRQGIAKALAHQLVADAHEFCQIVTCNAQATPAAPLFWEALGFVPSYHKGITHSLTLSPRL